MIWPDVSSEVVVQRLASFVLVFVCFPSSIASTIRVAITGTTSAVYVQEGPIFGYSSYEHIPDGTPFTLIYTFEDNKGKEKILALGDGVITESEIEDTILVAPGTNAILQIGDATWEFGTSTRSSARLNTSPSKRRYELTFATPARDNRISTVIQPTKDGFWPTNADWRASFMATSLMDSTGEFSADNGRVSARGHLLLSTFTISGVDLGEQWLSYITIAGSPKSASWNRQWHLAHPSPKGGYIVQEVTRTFTGVQAAKSAITSTKVKYWEAWRVPPQSADAADAVDSFEASAHGTGGGINTVSATARFYEGLHLPAGFAVGQSPYAGSRLSSTSAPHLRTNRATLPVIVEAMLQ
jgi:hypothetical protein